MVSRNLLSWGAWLTGLGAVCLLLAGESVLEFPGRVDAALRGQPYAGLRCSFRERTGRPCVGCGATTAFLLARRGQILDSAKASALGLMSAGGLLLLAVGAATSGISGKPRPLVVAALGAGGLLATGLAVQFVRWWADALVG